jgi:hypothetical protein
MLTKGKTKTINKNAQKEDSLAYNGIGQTGRRSEGGNIIKKPQGTRVCN